MHKLKWFLGEFFVVVAGVLVAFLLNGWWMNIKESEKEKTYLKQVHADINATIRQVEAAEAEQRTTLHAASRLLAMAYSNSDYADSTAVRDMHYAMSFAPASHVSATLSSLVSTGELQLISDDSLRLALGELVSGLEGYTTTNDHMAFDWLIPAYERLADNVALADLRYQTLTDDQLAELSADTLRGFPTALEFDRPPKQDLSKLLKEPGFRQNLIKLQIAQTNLWRVHTSFLDDLKKTRTKLEAVMDRHGIPAGKEQAPAQVE